MPLKLITGPANSGKAGAVLGEYHLRLEEDPFLVVPTFEDVEHYRRELASKGAVFGGNVVRFSRLMRTVARQAGYLASVVGPVQRDLIVAQAVKNANLTLLAESASTDGFVHASRRLIGELESSMVEPQRFYMALRAWAASSASRRTYGDEVASIYSHYRALLEKLDSVDQDLFTWGALEALRGDSAAWPSAPLFFYGFDDFTPVQLEAIKLLSGEARSDVVVAVTHDSDHVAFADRQKTVETLEPLATEHIELEPSDDHYAEHSRSVLAHVERGIFQNDAEKLDPGDSVRLFRSGGERAEAELVAAEILKMLRSGTAPADVAVVYRSPSQYASLIEQVFSGYGVPYTLDWNVPLSHTSLGQGFLALVDCALGDGTADDLLNYLRTPGRVNELHLVDRLEADVRREGIETAADVHRKWEEDHARWRLEEIDRLAAARELGHRALLDQLAAELERMFTGPYRRAAHILADRELDDARVYTSALSALHELAEIAAADNSVTMSAEDVRRSLEALPIRLGPSPRAGRVRVTDPQAIRARRFEAVFVCGLQEGEFPRLARPDPFFPDRERHEIAAVSGLILRDHEKQLDAERYLFYVCTSRPEKLLVLSYRESDEEGNPRVRSFFVDDMRDLFTDRLTKEATTRSLGEVTWTPGAAPTEHELARARAALGKRTRLRPIAPLSDRAVLERLIERKRFSAGALEAFADCPVKWLVDKFLRIEALEPQAMALASGSFAHAVLERTLSRLRDATGSARVTEKTLAEARQILIQAVNELRDEQQITPDQTRQRIELRRIEFDLLELLGHEADGDGTLEPEHLELRFGMETSELPPLCLSEDGVELNGIIDRVDVADGKALVRDYKGRTSYPVAKWEEERRLQVAIYMLAVRSLLGLEPIGGVYQAVRKPDQPRPRGMLLDTPDARAVLGDAYVRTDWRGPEDFQRQLVVAEQAVLDVISEIRAGALKPCPEECGWAGSGCSYPTICRSEGT